MLWHLQTECVQQSQTSLQPALHEYRKNIHSQNGEDGVIQEILRRLQLTHGVSVEFGAADGPSLSNTFWLFEQGWNGIFIEWQPQLFEKLLENVAGRAVCLQKYVTPSGPDSLDNILKQTPFDRFDLISIDVDGIDYQIWEGFTSFRPAIVIIEINSSIPPGVEQIHGTNQQGTGFTPMLRLGRRKGYSFVCHTGNMIFVRDDLIGALFLGANSYNLFDHNWLPKY